jgi:hypothetical protein
MRLTGQVCVAELVSVVSPGCCTGPNLPLEV